MAKLKPPALKKPNFKNKKTVGLSLLLLVMVVTVGWSFLGDNIQNKGKLYAEAAGHKIYEKEVRDLIGDNKEVTDQEATRVLADKYFTEALAKEQNVSVSEEDIVNEYGEEISQQKIDYKYAYQNKVNQLYFKKLSVNHAGAYKGQYLVTHFSRHIPYKSGLLAENKVSDPELGNRAVIAKDKKYAENLINRLRDEISSGKISFEEAIKIEKDDPVVGEDVYPTLTHSGSFDTSVTPFTLADISSIENNGEKLKPGELSPPFAVKVSNSAEGNSTAESYFVMVRLDSASGGQATMSYRQFIEQAKERLEYEVYV